MASQGVAEQQVPGDIRALFTTSPPPVSSEDAERVARACFPGSVACAPLSGERDANFRVTRADGSILTLKFINCAEQVAETEMQVEVLKHLRDTMPVQAPHHQPIDPAGLAALSGSQAGQASTGPTLDWIQYRPLSGGHRIRVRAYGYLPGAPGTNLQADPRSWRAVGRTAAILDRTLQQFDHPAAHRKFLWDACQVLDLRPLLNAVESLAVRQVIAEFLALFEHRVTPVLDKLPRQVIHNDLSPSNILVEEDGLELAGILDFGDMVYAPRIAEIAIAGSYLMTYSLDPMRALDGVVTGYCEVSPLHAMEHAHLLDLVLARLAQRMVITAWRAARFPGNRDYIMRSHDAATALFNRLYPDWRAAQGSRSFPSNAES
ncbi:phosphotransferase [Bordetella muralis]|uniref:phosphotransferase n=1 Tax=Bordetella muralis TaxID=1649130 RepID=UPI0039F04131